jgi:four helix bundle protein
LELYRDAMEIGERIWNVAVEWGVFAQTTVGSQIVRATDSIAANIAEGYGRYHYKENIKFCYYSRGSAEECQTWLEKAARRGLMDPNLAELLDDEMEVLKKRLNAYIASIGPRESR